MIYRAWIKPGMNPSKNSRILMRKSFEQMPLFSHTATGGTNMAKNTRNQSCACIFG